MTVIEHCGAQSLQYVPVGYFVEVVKRLQRLQNPKFSFDMVEVFRRTCSWEKNPFYIPNLTLISYCRPGEAR